MANTMMDFTNTWYNELNCAQSVLLGGCEALGLSVPPEVRNAFGPFGGGLCCGESCGALCGALGVLGMLTQCDNLHANPEAKAAADAMIAAFSARFGAMRCADLKPRYATPERRCSAVVEGTAELLEALCASYKRP
ncbi:MAG: C-GCAxxG-C-C family protein [Oscillospiraceae bacterium]